MKPRICFRKNLLGESNIAVVAHGSERPYLRMDTSSVSEGKKCRTEIHRVKFSNISSLEKKTNPALPCWPSAGPLQQVLHLLEAGKPLSSDGHPGMQPQPGGAGPWDAGVWDEERVFDGSVHPQPPLNP